MHEIYALKEMLCKQLKEYGRKGELSAAILERVDMLAHAVKNLDKIIEVYEMQEDGEYSNSETSYGMNGTSRRGYSRNGMSRARGRGQRRDSMGRYSSENGNSRYGGNSTRYDGGSSYEDGMEDMVESIRGMMQELPPEVQRDAQRFVQKLEDQM